MEPYGKELILDLHNCRPETYDSREKIEDFLVQLCDLIDMEREDLHFWDYKGMPEEYDKAPDHLKGISAVQFIKTSNVTIHTLDALKKIYINIFSCKGFSDMSTGVFCADFFCGDLVNSKVIERF